LLAAFDASNRERATEISILRVTSNMPVLYLASDCAVLGWVIGLHAWMGSLEGVKLPKSIVDPVDNWILSHIDAEP
jgi:hypothetical protein